MYLASTRVYRLSEERLKRIRETQGLDPALMEPVGAAIDSRFLARSLAQLDFAWREQKQGAPERPRTRLIFAMLYRDRFEATGNLADLASALDAAVQGADEWSAIFHASPVAQKLGAGLVGSQLFAAAIDAAFELAKHRQSLDSAHVSFTRGTIRIVTEGSIDASIGRAFVMPWLPSPDPEPQLWEGPLEALQEDQVRSPNEEIDGFDARSLPHAAIGPPETWPFTELYPPAAMPPELRALIDEADFYLVRLRFSFRPTKDDVVIKWARFAVGLLGDGDVRAEAVHPERVEDTVQKTRRFTIGPTLEFLGVNVGTAEADFGIEYENLEPFVWGAADPPTTPSWDYEPTTGRQLYGQRWMHLLLRAEAGTPRAEARLHLVTEVAIKRKLFRRATTPRDPGPLRVTLWGD